MIRLPCEIRRPDGAAIARLTLHPDMGILVASQIDGHRETRLIGPSTAQTYANGLIRAGWFLVEVAN